MYKRQVLDTVRISGIKVIQKWVSSGDTEARVNICRERERVMKVKSEYGRIGHISFLMSMEL